MARRTSRTPRLRRSGKTVLAGAKLVVLLLVPSACGRLETMQELEGDGVRLRMAQRAEPPNLARSALVVERGDFVLTGPLLRVVVGGMGRKPEQRGTVLEAISEGMSAYDGIVSLAPRLQVRGVSYRVPVADMRILDRGGTPTLRVDGVLVVAGAVFEVSRELSIARVGSALSISTRILPAAAESNVYLGTRVMWGGPIAQLPGLGEVEDEAWHPADWVSSEGATGASLFAYKDGGMRVRAAYERRGNARLPLHTDVLQAEALELRAGQPLYVKSLLSVTATGVARSVRRLGFWRGTPFPEAWARLPYHPEGSEVRLFDGAMRPLLSARPDELGRAVLPLTASDTTDTYVAIARAYGHADSDPYRWPSAEPARFELVIPAGGRIRVRVVDAADQRGLPARVRLLPVGTTAKPQLGPDYRAEGAGDTVIALAGRAAITVPPGRYRALVTHGPEWSLHEAEVDVTATFSPLIEAALRREVDPGAWVACDLHLHAAPSPDSEVTLEDRLASLRAEGIRFAVATDHNHVTDYGPTAHALGLHDMRTVTGVEVTPSEPVFGHFNAYPYPLKPDLPGNGAPESVNLDATRLFQALRAVDPDLVVQVNHPRSEGGIGYFDVMHFDAVSGSADPGFSDDFDALEVWNGFDLARPEQIEPVFRDFVELLRRGKRVAATGSSDSHQVRYQLAGYPRTYAYVPRAPGEGDELPPPKDIVRAIKRGATFVTSGPLLDVQIDDAKPGDTVTARDGRVTLQVRASVPSWMTVERLQVWLGNTVVIDKKWSLPTPKTGKRELSERLPLQVAADDFVIVRISSAQSLERFFGRAAVLPIAFTNPIFIDADGDGHTLWSPGKAVPVQDAGSPAAPIEPRGPVPAPVD